MEGQVCRSAPTTTLDNAIWRQVYHPPPKAGNGGLSRPMSTGLLFCFLGAISFGLLASVSKMAERRKCNASALVVSLFVWAMVAMLVRTATLRSGFYLPAKAIGVGVACGICGAVAYFAFQSSIQIGKVTVGWLMMNLSVGVPALFSIWIYKETLSPLKLSAFALAGVSLLFLFWGHRAEEQEAEKLRDTKEGAD